MQPVTATCTGCVRSGHARLPRAGERRAGSAARLCGRGSMPLVEQACESCHGPGAKHAESTSAADIRNPAKLAPAQTDRACLTCHLSRPTHAGRIQSSHARNLVACTSCHKVHANGPFGLVARKPGAVNEQCAGCHRNVLAQFQRPFKHRIPESAMSCVDCHNPHGSFRPGMMPDLRGE